MDLEKLEPWLKDKLLNGLKAADKHMLYGERQRPDVYVRKTTNKRNWKDPTRRHLWEGGKLYEQRRCTYVNQLGNRCKNWSLKDHELGYCNHHARRKNPVKIKAKKGLEKGHVEKTKLMPGVYSKHLSKTLSEAVEEQLSVSPAQQAQLYEELALLRVAAAQAVEMFSIAHEAYRLKPTEVTQSVLQHASIIMRDHLQQVTDTCEKAARIENSIKDKFSIHQLYFFVNQMVSKMYDVLGDEGIEIASQLEHAFRTGISLPQPLNSGTSKTPDMDQDVIDMDCSVPGGDNTLKIAE